jgi:hypothetical protein
MICCFPIKQKEMQLNQGKKNFYLTTVLFSILLYTSCCLLDENSPLKINLPPTAQDIELTAKKNGELKVDLSEWAFDANSDTLYFYMVVKPSYGIGTIWPEGDLVYFPDEDFIGTDQVGYYVSDQSDSSPIYWVRIYVEEN